MFPIALDWLRVKFQENEGILNLLENEIDRVIEHEQIVTSKLIKLGIRNCALFERTININFNMDGITLLIGSNGSGKTTIIDFILFALTGKYKNNLKNLYITYNRELKIRAYIELNNKNYRIERNIPFNVKNRRVTTYAINLNDQLLHYDNQRKDITEKFFKIKSREVFDILIKFLNFPETLDNFLISDLKEDIEFRKWIFNQIVGLYDVIQINSQFDNMLSSEYKEKRILEDQIHSLSREQERIDEMGDVKKKIIYINGLKNFNTYISKKVKNLEEFRIKLNKELYSTDFDKYSELLNKKRNFMEEKVNLEDNIKALQRKIEIDYPIIRLSKRSNLSTLFCKNCIDEVINHLNQGICHKCGGNLFKDNKKDQLNQQEIENKLNKLKLEKEEVENKINKIDDEIEKILYEKNEKLSPIRSKVNKINKRISNLEKRRSKIKNEVKNKENEIIRITNFDKRIVEIKKDDIETVKKRIKNILILKNGIEEFDSERKIDFLNQFNNEFNNLINQITGKDPVIEFYCNGVINYSDFRNFNSLCGEEKITYEIAFRLCLYRRLHEQGLEIPLIIENGGFVFDTVIKERLASTIVNFSQDYHLPLIITSCDDIFSEQIVLNINEEYITKINDFSNNITEDQKIRLRQSLDQWLNN